MWLDVSLRSALSFYSPETAGVGWAAVVLKDG
jgi:hypothetical protein